jgi:hypothetical protein
VSLDFFWVSLLRRRVLVSGVWLTVARGDMILLHHSSTTAASSSSSSAGTGKPAYTPSGYFLTPPTSARGHKDVIRAIYHDEANAAIYTGSEDGVLSGWSLNGLGGRMKVGDKELDDLDEEDDRNGDDDEDESEESEIETEESDSDSDGMDVDSDSGSEVSQIDPRSMGWNIH